MRAGILAAKTLSTSATGSGTAAITIITTETKAARAAPPSTQPRAPTRSRWRTLLIEAVPRRLLPGAGSQCSSLECDCNDSVYRWGLPRSEHSPVGERFTVVAEIPGGRL